MISLVEESAEIANEDIKKDILNELSRGLARVPWIKEVEKVTVTEE